MTNYARIHNGVVAEMYSPPAGFAIEQCFAPGLTWVDVTSDPSVAIGWTYEAGVFAAPVAPAPPVLTLAQQAQAALSAGLVITSTATPALDGTYACDDAAQAKLNRMWGLIQRAGGTAFPGGLSALPWVDTSGVAHSFTRVSDFLALETAIGDYVLALDLVIATGTGTLPPATATIA